MCVGECTPYSHHVSGENEDVCSKTSEVSVCYVTDFSLYIVEMEMISSSCHYGYVIFLISLAHLTMKSISHEETLQCVNLYVGP
jgi:hypothetical protein